MRSTPAEPGAEPVLFVHGLGGASRNWTDLMDVLRQTGPAAVPDESHRPNGRDAGWTRWPAGRPLGCEALDLPGNGYSPPPPDGDYSVRAQAAVVAALIEARGRGPVHLVGNSLGGAICTRLAARRPDLIRTLTLISPALPDLRPRPVPARISVLQIPGVGPWLIRGQEVLAAAAGGGPAARRLLRPQPGASGPDRGGDRGDQAAERARLHRRRRAQVGQGSDLRILPPRPRVALARRRPGQGRVLALYGSHDRLVDPRMAVRAARTFPRVRTVVLPRTGHVAQMERPDEVASEMRIMSRPWRPAPRANPPLRARRRWRSRSWAARNRPARRDRQGNDRPAGGGRAAGTRHPGFRRRYTWLGRAAAGRIAAVGSGPAAAAPDVELAAACSCPAWWICRSTGTSARSSRPRTRPAGRPWSGGCRRRERPRSCPR